MLGQKKEETNLLIRKRITAMRNKTGCGDTEL
jgi:hypothetical protein